MLGKVWSATVRRKTESDLTSTDTKLKKCLSTMDLTFIGVSGTLGTGIYVLSGEVAKNKAGPGIVLSFLIAAIVSLLSALCYAELGVRFPKAGSAYSYCYIAIGEICAFFIGWIMLLEYIIGVAVSAKTLSSYVDSIANKTLSTAIINTLGEIHIEGLSPFFDALSLLIIVMITIMSCIGIKTSAILNSVVVSVNVTTLSVIVIAGLTKADISNWSPFAPFGITGILQGAATCFFAFIGFDTIMTTSEESKNPGRSIPLSIFYTVAISLLLYVGVSVSLTLMLPYYKLEIDSTFSAAFKLYHMHALVNVVSTGVIVAITGSIIVSSLAPVRILYAMAMDGMFPTRFAYVNGKGVPVYGVLISGLLNAILASLFDMKTLADMMSIGTLLAYSLVDISLLVLRYRLTEKETRVKDTTYTNSFKERFDEAKKSQSVINTIIFILVIGSFTASIFIGLFSKQLFIDRSLFLILLFAILLILILTCGLFLNSLEQNIPQSSFITPQVPWVPMIALLTNFTLLMMLSPLTWIRLAIWSVVGLIIYFGYSMHYSVKNYEETEYTQLKQVDENETLDLFKEEEEN